jgi:DNA sulfur modification protein DndB
VNSYSFAAIRGVQAGRAYYVIMVPLRVVGRLLRYDDGDLPPELRAQRDLNKGRIPAISRYIIEHAQDYVLPPLSASIDGKFRFNSHGGDGPGRSLGVLIVDMTATMLINDGQHRRAGIIEALKERPHLGDETIAVTVFPDQGLSRSQQMFVDLNQHGVKPARSLRLYYDNRDQETQLARAVVEAVPLFRDMTDFTRSNLTGSSRKLFAFSNLHTAIIVFAEESGIPVNPDNAVSHANFWTAVADAIPDWRLARAGLVAPSELRRDKVHAHGVALEAIAVAGARLMVDRPSSWPTVIAGLAVIDWSRQNTRMWEGRALVGGRIHRSRTSVQMTADVIFRSLGQIDADGAVGLG